MIPNTPIYIENIIKYIYSIIKTIFLIGVQFLLLLLFDVEDRHVGRIGSQCFKLCALLDFIENKFEFVVL